MSYARTAVTRMTLDMSRLDLQRSETVTQGDTNRRWEVTLINGGAPFRLPPNWTAALTGIKPDGTGLLNGCSVADGKIVYDFAAGAEIATCVGSYPVQFDIWDEVGELVASPKVYVNVLDDVRPHAELESNGQYTIIGELIGRVNQTDADVDLLGETALAQGDDITALKAKITTEGTVTIPASEWTDTLPKLAFPEQPVLAKGTVALLMPGNTASQIAAREAKITVQSEPYGNGKIVVQREDGEAPTDNITLDYIIIKVDNPEAPPKAALIGVDAYGEGGDGTASGVDEEAVKALIDKEVPEWARAKQKPTYTPEEVKARPDTWMPTAEEVGADPANTAQTLVDDLARKIAQDLANYYTKYQTLTKDEINALVSAIPKFDIKVVASLPTSNISETTVYLVKSGADSTNLYTEYIRANGAWERLGAQTVDLTGYATEAWVNELIATYVKTADMEAYVAGLLKAYITKDVADKTYQPIGDYLTPTTGDQRYAKPDDVVEIVANNKDEIADAVADKLLEPVVGRNKYNEDNSIPYTSSLTGNCLRGTAYLPPSEGQYTIYISSAGSGNYTYIYDPSQNDLLKTETMVVYDENGVAVSGVTFSPSGVRNSAKTRSGKTIVVPAGANAHKLEFLYRISSGSGATLCSEMMVTIGYMPEEYEPYEETLVLDGLDYATPEFVAENYVSKKIYYVSTDGNDENDGSKDAPLATLKKALDLGATRIAMEVGEYFIPSVVTLSNLNDVRIYAYRDGETYDHAKPVRDKVRITGGRYYSGYAKNADGVYQQASVTGGFNYSEVFVNKSKSPTINARTYHANLMIMHEDVSKDYYLKPVLTYDECKTTANTFFWDGSTLSFNTTSTDFIEVGVICAEQCLLLNNCSNLVLEDIAVEMCKSNVIGINNCDGVIFNNCEANASAISMGFAFDNTNGVLNNCYATKNAYDGFNFHGYGTTTMNDCTAENNYDDGCSHHDGCIGTINGGRFFGSGKAGIAPAYGANVNIYNVIARDNNIGIGYLTASNGHASMRGVVSGCALIDNNTGLQVDALASVVVIGCRYHGNTADKATTGSLEEY